MCCNGVSSKAHIAPFSFEHQVRGEGGSQRLCKLVRAETDDRRCFIVNSSWLLRAEDSQPVRASRRTLWAPARRREPAHHATPPPPPACPFCRPGCRAFFPACVHLYICTSFGTSSFERALRAVFGLHTVVHGLWSGPHARVLKGALALRFRSWCQRRRRPVQTARLLMRDLETRSLT